MHNKYRAKCLLGLLATSWLVAAWPARFQAAQKEAYFEFPIIAAAENKTAKANRGTRSSPSLVHPS
jgi:hypothetical protein